VCAPSSFSARVCPHRQACDCCSLLGDVQADQASWEQDDVGDSCLSFTSGPVWQETNLQLALLTQTRARTASFVSQRSEQGAQSCTLYVQPVGRHVLCIPPRARQLIVDLQTGCPHEAASCSLCTMHSEQRTPCSVPAPGTPGHASTGFPLRTPRARPRALGLAFDSISSKAITDPATFPATGVKCVVVLKPLLEPDAARPRALAHNPEQRTLTLRKLRQAAAVEEVCAAWICWLSYLVVLYAWCTRIRGSRAQAGRACAQREFGADTFDEVYDGADRLPVYKEAAGLVSGAQHPACFWQALLYALLSLDVCTAERKYSNCELHCPVSGYLRKHQRLSACKGAAVLEGRSAAVLAYGQTGSGKTYQMQVCTAAQHVWATKLVHLCL